jgi:hypothetical protein
MVKRGNVLANAKVRNTGNATIVGSTNIQKMFEARTSQVGGLFITPHPKAI